MHAVRRLAATSAVQSPPLGLSTRPRCPLRCSQRDSFGTPTAFTARKENTRTNPAGSPPSLEGGQFRMKSGAPHPINRMQGKPIADERRFFLRAGKLPCSGETPQSDPHAGRICLRPPSWAEAEPRHGSQDQFVRQNSSRRAAKPWSYSALNSTI